MKKFIALLLVAIMVLALNVAVVADNEATLTDLSTGQNIDVKTNINITKNVDENPKYSVALSWSMPGEIAFGVSYTWNPLTHQYNEQTSITKIVTKTDMYIEATNHSNREVKVGLVWTATVSDLVTVECAVRFSSETDLFDDDDDVTYFDTAESKSAQSKLPSAIGFNFDDNDICLTYNFRFVVSINDVNLLETNQTLTDAKLGTITVQLSAVS